MSNLHLPFYHGSSTISLILYINLKDATDRKQFMQRWLSKQVIPYQRFPAIDGHKLADGDRYLIKITQQRGNNTSSRGPSENDAITLPRVQGCYLSHLKVLNIISRLPQGLYLVMEDDAQLTATFFQELPTLLSSMLEDWDILKIDNFSEDKTLSTIRGAKVKTPIYRLGPAIDTGQNLGTAAYLVRHQGGRVKKLLHHITQSPLRHIDGVFNLVMDDIKFYGMDSECYLTRFGHWNI